MPILGYNAIEYLILNGSPEEQEALKTSLKGRNDRWDLEPFAAVIHENAESVDFLTDQGLFFNHSFCWPTCADQMSGKGSRK